MSWAKVLLTNAAARGAVCLDGTPGGYYIRRGDPARWLIFHQGGGWCSSDDSCADRAQTDLGSSKGTRLDGKDGKTLVKERRTKFLEMGRKGLAA